MPWLGGVGVTVPPLGDGGATGVKQGRHLKYPPYTPMANLFMSMLDKLGIPAETMGDSTGKLDGLSL